MTVDTAIAAWESLVRIAGQRASVHITGGEPFLYYERLVEIMSEAKKLGLAAADSIETNAVWGSSEQDIEDKLRLLDSLGMDRLKISWDVFHEEFVEIEKVQRLVSIAQKALGSERVLVRWQQHLDHPTGIARMSEDQKRLVLIDALASDPCRFTGRAGEELARWIAQYPAEAFRGNTCQNALLSAKGVHIDPEGYVFNGQCSGMIVGNVTQKPLDLIWKEFEPDRQEFWKVLYEYGPFGFLEQACNAGYKSLAAYASKCHLCTDIRRFFFDKGLYSTIIGPNNCYGHYHI